MERPKIGRFAGLMWCRRGDDKLQETKLCGSEAYLAVRERQYDAVDDSGGKAVC